MYVALGKTRLDAINAATQGYESVKAELLIEQQWLGTTCVIKAPYGCWVIVREALAEKCFTKRGAKNREAPRYSLSALRIVSTAINDTARHPALRRLGMIGHQAQVLHTWALTEPDDMGRYYSPIPVDIVDGFYAGRAPFVVLKPVFHEERGTRLTTWSPDGLGPAEDRLADESAHLPFAG